MAKLMKSCVLMAGEINVPAGCTNGAETYKAASPSQIYIRTGIEVWLNRAVAIRGGYGLKNGSDSATTLSFGGSAKLNVSSADIQLDYGFQLLSGDFQNNTTQRFSINLMF